VSERTVLQMRKFLSPEFVFGPGALHLVGRYAANFSAQRALVVSDPGVVEAGWAERVIRELRESGTEPILYADVSENPRTDEVGRGAELFSRRRCSIVVAVGGGSPLDCAKGISLLSTNGGDIREYEGVDKVPLPGSPLVMLPTTAGSAAEVSQFAIISDPRARRKFAIISKMIVPDVALIDPETTVTLDGYRTACCAMDTLCHAAEAYVSNASSPVTDLFSLEAVRLVGRNLLPTLERPEDPLHRSELMLASAEAGMAFSNASLGLVHAMAHAAGGWLDAVHGELNALLLEHAVRYNFPAAPERYRRIGEALGLDLGGCPDEAAREALSGSIRDLRLRAGLKGSLTGMGLTRSDIPDLVRNALADPCIVTNPRKPTPRDVEELYESAL